MKDFILPKSHVSKVSPSRVDLFIDTFNSAIEENVFTLNTGLNRIPELSQDEFNLAKEQARNNGYDLSQYDDNYNTTTYKLTYIGK